MANRKPWSRSELLVAASLYCRIPFGRFHSRNPELIHVAGIIGDRPQLRIVRVPVYAAVHSCLLCKRGPNEWYQGRVLERVGGLP